MVVRFKLNDQNISSQLKRKNFAIFKDIMYDFIARVVYKYLLKISSSLKDSDKVKVNSFLALVSGLSSLSLLNKVLRSLYLNETSTVCIWGKETFVNRKPGIS